MKTNRTRPLGALLGALITLWTLSAQAQAGAPSLMTYQGRLKESGLPVTASRSVEILVCDAPTLGVCIPTGPQNVAVTNGLFRTTFTTSGWNPTAGSWYLEVQVGAVALMPRELLTSSPYALYASSATTLVANAGTAGVFISTHLFIVGGGNVGIGVTSPSARLHIGSGAIRISTSAAPPLPPAAEAGLYYDSGINRLMVSQNGEAFRKLVVMEQLGVTTLGAPFTSISLAGLPARQSLTVYLISPGKSVVGSQSTARFNADVAANYAYRLSNNGVETTAASTTGLIFTASPNNAQSEFIKLEISNPVTQDKIIMGTRGDGNNTGAASVPNRDEMLGKWVNAGQVTGVQFDASAGNFQTGTTLVVLGSE